MATKSIQLNKINPKALYHRALANRNLKNYDQACNDIKLALECAPTDKTIRAEYLALKKEKREYDKTTKNAFSKFLGEGIYNERKANLTKFLEDLPEFKADNPQVYFDLKYSDDEA